MLETGKFSQLAEALSEWRATALALWDEERNRDREGYQVDQPILEEEF